jgi:hypothetical protein
MSVKIPGDPAGDSGPAASSRPSLDSARRRLGGKPVSPSTRAPGLVVHAILRDGQRHRGVVLWSSEQDCDVWFEDGVARRVRGSAVSSYGGAIPESLARISAEARLFAMLAPGERVRWQRSTPEQGGSAGEGCIVEKCRYGAILVTRDGRLIAVGFRRLWPAIVRPVA